jgi:protein SCO1/2
MSSTSAARAPLRKRALLALAGLAALLAGYWAGDWLTNPSPQKQNELQAATLWPQPRALSDVPLADHNGERFDLQRLRGKWSFLFFGYTHCPDICPTTLAELSNVHAALQAQAPDALSETQFVFVSVDPDRDTPDRLREYVTYFNPDFLGVTGSAQILGLLARQVGIVFAKSEERSPGDYLVDHSVSVILIDPQARLHAVFSRSAGAPTMSRDFLRIRSRYTGDKSG